MGKQVNLAKLSDSELVKLQKDVGKALASRDEQKRKDALEAARAEAKKHGFNLQDLVGPAKGSKPKSALPPKYRHPENPEVTWSGRGRQPRWIKEALEQGKSLDGFAI